MDRKARVSIDFPNPLLAIQWFQQLILKESLPEGVALFAQDGIDEMVGESGVPSINRFIVRREGDRPRQIAVSEVFEITIEDK